MDGRRKVSSRLQMRALNDAKAAKTRCVEAQEEFELAVIRAYQLGCALRDFERHGVGITGSGVKKILDRHGIPTRTRRQPS